jgi:RHS repeat-associated protein
MLMPKRSETFGSNTYRFGFQGQEGDDEVSGEGNSYTAEFWQYDSRLGRRFNVDPIFKEYESPYACFGNSPISVIDPNGADSTFYGEQGYEIPGTRIENEAVAYFAYDKEGGVEHGNLTYRQGKSYHSLFGDEMNEGPSRYSSVVNGTRMLSEKYFKDITSNAFYLNFGSPSGSIVSFWFNSGYKKDFDYKYKGDLKDVSSNQAISFGGGILMNKNEVGMLYWGYAAGIAYGGPKWKAYKRLANDNKWMHQSIEGNSDEWGEVHSWTYGFFLSKNGGKYYPQLGNDISKAMSYYYGNNVNYQEMIYPYGAKKDAPKLNMTEKLIENILRGGKVIY